MRRFEGHQQGETKRDEAVFTESEAVKVSYVWSRLSTPSRHNRAICASIFGLMIDRDIDGRIRVFPAYSPLVAARYESPSLVRVI